MNRSNEILTNRRLVALAICLFAPSGVASAASNVPSGITGLWRFEEEDANTGDATMKATIGTDLVNSTPGDNGNWFTAPSIQIGTMADPSLYQDSGVAQIRSFDYLTATHGIAPNGGGTYVNEYTFLWDYRQTSGVGNWNSFYQTAADAHANDGDLWTNPSGQVGVGDAGYSTLTYDPGQWNRIVLSVDNGNFFRVYVNGTLFLDGTPQAVDGRFSLEPFVHLLVDDNFEDQWGLLGTFMAWDHALTSDEVVAMGGWEEDQSTGTGNPFPTPMVLPIPEPASLALIGFGMGSSLILLRRR